MSEAVTDNCYKWLLGHLLTLVKTLKFSKL